MTVDGAIERGLARWRRRRAQTEKLADGDLHMLVEQYRLLLGSVLAALAVQAPRGRRVRWVTDQILEYGGLPEGTDLAIADYCHEDDSAGRLMRLVSAEHGRRLRADVRLP